MAAAVAAIYLEDHEPGAILAVMPSDHVVKDEARFAEAVEQAAEVAARGKLLLLGVAPTEPHTGYGYIRQGSPLEGCNGSAFSIDAFVEKPDRATAESYIAAGGYRWNSGVFVMSAEAYLGELASFEPTILEAARKAVANAKEDLGFLRLDGSAFAAAPNLSIDYAVMEKTSAGAVLNLDCGWSDVGSWSSLWEISPRDESDNVVRGQALLEDTTGCYVHSEKALVATLGVRDLIIAETPDALLVADKGRAQEVSKIVARLQAVKSPGARAAPAQSPTLGPFRALERWEAFSGQAAEREARGKALPADASPSIGALDRRVWHGEGNDRRVRAVGGREREHLHPCDPMAPAGEPRKSAPRSHRGADRQLSRRGRHRALG